MHLVDAAHAASWLDSFGCSLLFVVCVQDAMLAVRSHIQRVSGAFLMLRNSGYPSLNVVVSGVLPFEKADCAGHLRSNPLGITAGVAGSI